MQQETSEHKIHRGCGSSPRLSKGHILRPGECPLFLIQDSPARATRPANVDSKLRSSATCEPTDAVNRGSRKAPKRPDGAAQPSIRPGQRKGTPTPPGVLSVFVERHQKNTALRRSLHETGELPLAHSGTNPMSIFGVGSSIARKVAPRRDTPLEAAWGGRLGCFSVSWEDVADVRPVEQRQPSACVTITRAIEYRRTPRANQHALQNGVRRLEGLRLKLIRPGHTANLR